MRLRGRTKIFTDQREITEHNIVEVLQKAYAKHRMNACEMQYLIDYELGVQPLPYEKTIRPEINIQTVDNMANYVTEFKKGYFWGLPPIYTQRGNKEAHGSDEEVDGSGISALNEMMLNGVCIGTQNQLLSDFVEKTGIGHRLIDVKTNWDDGIQSAYANVYTLDSRFAFCVYYCGVGQPKVLGVTYTKSGNKNVFTCFTDQVQYEIASGEIVSERPNLFGRIPIVEYERAVDRTGCFERQIPMMDNLNSLVSSAANDAVQRTQEIWWGNDIEFPTNEQGEETRPKSGQWVLTGSAEGKNPKIQPLSSTLDANPVLSNITETRNEILKKCFVPMQYSSEGGGSTGIASSLSAGWDAAAVDAMRQEQLIQGSLREELILILKAISLVPTSVLPAESPIKKLHHTDIDIKMTRRQNWDIATKANSFATLVSHGVHGRHALKVTNMFEDIEQVYLDSKEGIEEYQKSAYGSNTPLEDSNERIMQDSSDQAQNSPMIGSPRTGNEQSAE